MLPEALAPYLVLELTDFQTYGLFFLLGTFTVAALSDVKRLSAQREFMEVWLLAVAALLTLDLYQAQWRPGPVFAAKWGLLVLFCGLSHQRVGVFFRLARADVAACAAAAALLPAALIPAFWLALKLLSWATAGLLRGGRLYYPFMPVVTAATVGVLAIAKWGLPLAGL